MKKETLFLVDDTLPLLGIDPSYKRVGLCLWSGTGFKTARIDRKDRGYTGPLEKTFAALFLEAVSITNHIIASPLLREGISAVVIEQPPPIGAFAGGMHSLTSFLVRTFLNPSLNCRLFLAPPGVGRNLFSNGNWKKSDSVNVLKKVMGIELVTRASGDEGDALVMIIPFLKRFHSMLGLKKLVPYTEIFLYGTKIK